VHSAHKREPWAHKLTHDKKNHWRQNEERLQRVCAWTKDTKTRAALSQKTKSLLRPDRSNRNKIYKRNQIASAETKPKNKLQIQAKIKIKEREQQHPQVVKNGFSIENQQEYN
jgi:hypothetical protein